MAGALPGSVACHGKAFSFASVAFRLSCLGSVLRRRMSICPPFFLSFLAPGHVKMANLAFEDSSDALLPWVDPAFLNAFGLHRPLLYFAQCPAFDKTSNTAECLNQGLEARAMAAQLRTMVGVQYELLDTLSAPQLHCIGMFYRSGPDTQQLVKAYYILDGTVFRAPTLGEVLLRRIASCGRELGELMEDFQEATRVLPGGHPALDFSSPSPGEKDPYDDDKDDDNGDTGGGLDVGKDEEEGVSRIEATRQIVGPELDSIILNLWTQQ